jgi:nicotinamide-nucleotide amidase
MDINIVVDQIGIIAIGDELMSGFTINTNSSWIAKKISKYKNLTIAYNVIVSDDSEKIKVELDYLIEKKIKYIFMTGGLGPTHDDITKKTLSEYFSSKLIVYKEHLKKLHGKYPHENIKKNNHFINQSEIIEISKPINNNNGTAIGMSINVNKTTLFVMPGVPNEMKEMMQTYILPNFIGKKYSENKTCITILTFGIYETNLFNILKNTIIENKEFFKVAFLPSYRGVKIRISSKNSSIIFFNEFRKKIEDKISEYIYGYDEDRMEDIVAKLLSDKGFTLSAAESCTGGGLSKILTKIPGSSNYYYGSIIAYSNKIKTEVLGVNKELIHENGSVSREVAEAMSVQVQRKFNTDIGISITGISGPSGGTKEKPRGLVYISIQILGSNKCEKFVFKTERNIHQILTIYSALNLLRKSII